MEVMRMEPMADLSSTQEYSDIDLEGDSREEACCSPAVRGLVAVQVAARAAAAGSPGMETGEDPRPTPRARSSSPAASNSTSPPSSPSSSTISPQPQVNAVAPPPIRVTNFFISEILKPHFGGQKEDGTPATGEGSHGNASPTRPEADRSPSISPAKSENTPNIDRTLNSKKRGDEESAGERRAFQVVKRKRHKSEEERNSDICKLGSRDEVDNEFIGSKIRVSRPTATNRGEFPPHGLPPGLPPGGPLGAGGPGIHPSLQAHLYPQLVNNRYYQQYHPYYQLYYQQYQQLQQLQRQQQLYNALQQHNNRRLDPKSSLSLDIHHSSEGEHPLSRVNGKPEAFTSPQHKLTSAASHHHHLLREFPESYESFRSGVSPERRSSTSSENESIFSDNKPVRNLTKSFNHSSAGILQDKNIVVNHVQEKNIASKQVNNGVIEAGHQRLHGSSPHKASGAGVAHQQQKGFAAAAAGAHSPGAVSVCSSSDGGKSTTDGENQGTKDKDGRLWPAWVYCTRYSDRPSSGPRSRKMKKRKGSSGDGSPEQPLVAPVSASAAAAGRSGEQDPEDKRPRTAFSAEQLARLKKEFDENRYLTEQRRQQLARDLGLNESQIKIWFQNKRAKVKKASGQKNRLAMELMAQGLYNHATVPVDTEEK